MTPSTNISLNKAFDSFMQQSKKRLLMKEQGKTPPEHEEPTTPILAGTAYDKLRTIMLYPKTVQEHDYFDTVNLIIKAWHKRSQVKGNKK
jgi:hypothetical protein